MSIDFSTSANSIILQHQFRKSVLKPLSIHSKSVLILYIKKRFLSKRTSFLFFLLFFGTLLHAQEICNNALDDDNDGLIDLNDSIDCLCAKESTGNTSISLLPNPSFEQNYCVPQHYNYGTEAFCPADWLSASIYSTPDYMYQGGFNGAGAVPQPFPHGNGAMGMVYGNGYSEFVGANTLSTLQKAKAYTLTFEITGGPVDPFITLADTNKLMPPLDFYLYGSSSSNNLPMVNIATMTCVLGFGGYKALGSVSYSASLKKWTTVSIDFTPTIDVKSVIIGGPCQFPANYFDNLGMFQDVYFAIDNLILTEKAISDGVNSIIDAKEGSLCDATKKLVAHLPHHYGGYQWYKNGVAIVGENDTMLNVSQLHLGEGTYSFKRNKNIAGDTCEINAIVLKMENDCAFEMIWPNVFTPNNDGYNEYFSPTLASENGLNIANEISTMNFAVYDRWGIRIYQSEKEWPKWDGKINGETAAPGTYYFVFKYFDKNGDLHFHKGFIALMY